MVNKICKKCGKDLPVSEFYTHKKMKDGHLNVCKECVKLRNRRHREENEERYRLYENARQHSPHRILLRKSITTKRRKVVSGYQKAHNAVIRAVKNGLLKKPNKCHWCSNEKKVEAHHPDYNEPLEVVWLCAKCHKMLHLGKTNEAKRMRASIKIPF